MLDTDAASKLLGEYNDRTSEINRQIDAIIKADETGAQGSSGTAEIKNKILLIFGNLFPILNL